MKYFSCLGRNPQQSHRRGPRHALNRDLVYAESAHGMSFAFIKSDPYNCYGRAQLNDGDTMPLDERPEILQFLKSESIFGSIGHTALDKLAELGHLHEVSKDDSLFCMGQPCNALHFLTEGQARVALLSQDGRERILHLVLPGDMVGAVPFFDGKDYPCNVVAEVDCRFLAFFRDDLLKLLTQEGDVTLGILGGLVARQRRIVSHLEELSFEDTSSRLWRHLVENSKAPGDTYPRVVDPLPTREKIAGAIGTVREVVSRGLSALVKSGHVRIERRKLTLLKSID